MKKTNTLVVGQGIAGSLVAFMLHQKKVPFILVDPGNLNTSSRIAAGMFTPISGKRKTIHPIVLQQIPFAIKIYREMEQLLGTRFIHLCNIYQVHNSVAEQNEMNAKFKTPDFAEYILTDPIALPNLKQPAGAFEIIQSGWVDCELMITAFKQWLNQNDALIKAEFSYQDLQIHNEGMEYNGIHFSHIVFCEGYRAVDNPFFNNENIVPCKGDILTIHYEYAVTDRIIKKNGIYLIPAGNNTFRAGATYHWHNSDILPDEADKHIIESKLDAMLENRYTTIDHQSGIRPTTQSRMVIAKQHEQYHGMFMLNGLGTKGILQGPWWAKYIGELITDYSDISQAIKL